jgi:hypothetical protein
VSGSPRAEVENWQWATDSANYFAQHTETSVMQHFSSLSDCKYSEIPSRNVRHVDRLPTYADLWRLDR